MAKHDPFISPTVFQKWSSINYGYSCLNPILLQWSITGNKFQRESMLGDNRLNGEEPPNEL